MDLLNFVLKVLYLASCSFLLGYGAMQLVLIFKVIFDKKNAAPNPILTKNLPFVTFQLPIFNEKYVIENLFESILQLDYPQSKLQIQILDDSTDDTLEISKKWLQTLIKHGFDAEHINRTNRIGYKAGALQNALNTAKGEFIAIFDADFEINPRFLTEVLSHFEPNDGMIQTRWLFKNENDSMLTYVQAMALQAHFTTDQIGRQNANYYINFNGTGGIWRKTCIEDAGGWTDNSITEDLELSYRAQLKGWQFKYLPLIGNFSEIPKSISALKSQQFRWVKGAAECARLHLKAVLKKPEITIPKKLNSFFHLLNSANYLALFTISVLYLPVNYFFKSNGFVQSVSQVIQYFFIIYLFNTIVTAVISKKSILKSILHFPVFLAFVSGISFHMIIGVLQGYWGKKSAFVRTPKFSDKSVSESIYHKPTINIILVFEALLFIYYCLCFGFLFLINTIMD